MHLIISFEIEVAHAHGKMRLGVVAAGSCLLVVGDVDEFAVGSGVGWRWWWRVLMVVS